MNGYNVLNRFFSKQILLDIIDNPNNQCYGEIIKRYSISEKGTNKKIISSIYSLLNKGYRNEYFYKNSLLNELIVSKHLLKSTKVLTELPIANSKADFVLLNGKSVVYEIKTELDNLERLESQIADYYKCFPHVCVVTCETHLSKIIEMFSDTKVGIYLFSNRNKFEIIKEPEADYSNLDYEIMFKALRKYEFERIIINHFGELPKTTQFAYYTECYKLFVQIDEKELQQDMLTLLKNRCYIEIKSFSKIPKELRMLVYQSKLSEEQYNKLDKFLNSNYMIGEINNVFSIFEGQTI